MFGWSCSEMHCEYRCTLHLNEPMPHCSMYFQSGFAFFQSSLYLENVMLPASSANVTSLNKSSAVRFLLGLAFFPTIRTRSHVALEISCYKNFHGIYCPKQGRPFRHRTVKFKKRRAEQETNVSPYIETGHFVQKSKRS